MFDQRGAHTLFRQANVTVRASAAHFPAVGVVPKMPVHFLVRRSPGWMYTRIPD